MSLQDDGTLLISNAQLEDDNGKYICSAENKYGKETTSAFVTVTKKGVINSEEKDILLDEGTTVIFDCDVEVRYFLDVSLNMSPLRFSIYGMLWSNLIWSITGRSWTGQWQENWMAQRQQ